jgi:hypothetical protein
MLDRLGTTPEEVAATLQSQGIRGVRNTVRFLNPIVRYAKSCLDGASEIDLIHGDRLRIVFATGEVNEVPVPQPVQQFLIAFHQGNYPELELPGDSV